MKLFPTPQEYFDKAVAMSGKNFYYEESLSGYYRLFLDEDIIHDDSAYEDVYELDSALYFFANLIYEEYTNAEWNGAMYLALEELTINRAQELFGKAIKWVAPAYEGNAPYGGKAIITDIKASNRPLVCTILEGDNLNYAICEDDIHIDFSDAGRGVMYRLI